mgnify:CR=1 FL=1
MYSRGTLINYTKRICWLMATSNDHSFFKKYKKRDIHNAIAYLQTLSTGGSIPESVVAKATTLLTQPEQDRYKDHEQIIFRTYVELGSSRAVARHFNIPVKHVCKVVNNARKNLKEKICQ